MGYLVNGFLCFFSLFYLGHDEPIWQHNRPNYEQEAWFHDISLTVGPRKRLAVRNIKKKELDAA